MEKQKTDWGATARAATAREHKYEVERLTAELSSVKNAHKETLQALNAARIASTRLHKVAKASPAKASSDDLVEVIFSDVHGNKHDPAAFSRLIADLKSLKPDRIIIGGDFIDCGDSWPSTTRSVTSPNRRIATRMTSVFPTFFSTKSLRRLQERRFTISREITNGASSAGPLPASSPTTRMSRCSGKPSPPSMCSA